MRVRSTHPTKEDDVDDRRSIQVSARFYAPDDVAATIADGVRDVLAERPEATAVMQSRRSLVYDEHEEATERLLTIRFTGTEADGDEVAAGLFAAAKLSGVGGSVKVSSQRTLHVTPAPVAVEPRDV
jgi:hypothetical protein